MSIVAPLMVTSLPTAKSDSVKTSIVVGSTRPVRSMSCVVCVVGASTLRYESRCLYTLPRLRKSGKGSRPALARRTSRISIVSSAR